MKVGVIGTGNMGENHVRTYLSIRDHCELVGIYDKNENKRDQIAKKYKVKPFQSVDLLLQSVDAVSIAVPVEFHYEIGLVCIENKVHMLMEKPISSTVAQAEELLAKAREAGVIMQVGHIELFNPVIQLLAQQLENEHIIGIDFQRMSPYDERIKNVDVIKDLMIHDLYILSALLNDHLEAYYALGDNNEYNPTHAVVITKSSKGVTAQLTASFKSRKKFRCIQVLTEDAFIEADILNGKITITRTFTENMMKMPVPITQSIQVDQSIQPLRIQLLDFVNCVKSNATPTISGADGINALAISNKISDCISDSNNTQ
jgi:virulence factor